MICLLEKGKYSLFETGGHTRILEMDGDKYFAWIHTPIGEILVKSEQAFKPKELISEGNYRLYTVKNEPKLTDLVHLELFVGEGKWQGYLLPTGFPEGTKKRSRIIPTEEIISVYNPNISSSSSL